MTEENNQKLAEDKQQIVTQRCPVLADNPIYSNFHASSGRYCHNVLPSLERRRSGNDQGHKCSLLNAVSVISGLLSTASPCNPEYDSSLSSLCNTIVRCPYVAEGLLDNSPITNGLRESLFQRLVSHANDIVFPTPLVSASIATSRCDAELSSIVGIVSANPSFADEMENAVKPLQTYYRRHFLAAVITSPSTSKDIKWQAANLLFENDDAKRIDVLAARASSIIDQSFDLAPWTTSTDEHDPPWLRQLQVNGRVDACDTAGIRQLIDSKDENLFDTLLVLSMLNVFPEAASWILDCAQSLPGELERIIIEKIALASADIPFGSTIPDLDDTLLEHFQSNTLRDENGHLLPEVLLLLSIYWPKIALDDLEKRGALDYVDPFVEDTYNQLVFRYPEEASQIINSNKKLPLFFVEQSVKKHLKLLPKTTHALLTNLQIQQLGGKDLYVETPPEDFPELNLEVQNKLSYAIFVITVLLRENSDIVESIRATHGYAKSSKDVCKMIDHSTFNMATVLRQETISLPQFPSSTWAETNIATFLVLNQQIHMAFRTGDWRNIHSALRQYGGPVRLLATLSLAISSEEPVLHRSVGGFYNSDSLSEKLCYLRCIALCPGRNAEDQLRDISCSMAEPIGSLARTFLVHRNTHNAITKEMRESIYTRIFSGFVSTITHEI